MRRLYLSMDDRLFDAIRQVADSKGISPTSLVVSNLEDLYLKEDAVDYDGLLSKLITEAQAMPSGKAFLLNELPSFGELVVASARKAHISQSPIRARIGKAFNMAVSNGKVDGIERAKKDNGDLLNRGGVALFIRIPEEKPSEKDVSQIK